MQLKTHLVRILLVGILCSSSLWSFGQTKLPIDSVTGKIKYEGVNKVKPKCKKKINKRMLGWASIKQDFPPAVFSIVKQSKDTLILKVVTEVPSMKTLHPISFQTRIVVHKQSYSFMAEGFYFEDLNLSLENWLEKYAESKNERNIKNASMITQGIDSHVFLTFKNLTKIINQEK